MRSVIRYMSAIALVAHVVGRPSTVAGQASVVTACSVFDAAELTRLTGRKDFMGRGPRATETPAKGLSECGFLEVNFALTSNVTSERFRRTREGYEAKPERWKAQSVSGIGDEAYFMWDPRPGSFRSVGIVMRAGGKQLAIGTMVPSDSIETMRPMLRSIATLTVTRLK